MSVLVEEENEHFLPSERSRDIPANQGVRSPSSSSLRAIPTRDRSEAWSQIPSALLIRSKCPVVKDDMPKICMRKIGESRYVFE